MYLLKKGVMVQGKVGVKANMDMATVKAGVGYKTDAAADGAGDDKHYGKAYVSVGSDDVADSGVGAGVYGIGGTDLSGFEEWSYTGGVYVGSEKPEEADDYSVSVSYYNCEQ